MKANNNGIEPPSPRMADAASPENARPHLLYLAIGFPPAAKSCAYRMRETANQFCALGWDVTVVTISEESWERDSGVDHSLSEQVDPRVKVIELPLAREDLETDIRLFSEERARKPLTWLSGLRERNQQSFPEPVFGGWRAVLEQAALDAHREHPADLVLASCVPYVQLAAAWKLWNECRVPYAVDFRDGWSVDVIESVEAFSRDTEEGHWEQLILEQAISLWLVNDPIAEHYRARYPELASRIHVVRNGYDADSAPTEKRRAAETGPLTFGYLGTATFPAGMLETVLSAWRTAREQEPLLSDARFEFRGHIGAGSNREANRHTELLKQAAVDGVVFGGPVPKSEVAATYGGWDALVLMIIGGRYMTSGKVYEYMAAGLPIVSAHAAEHDASTVLSGHPLWTGASGLDEEQITAAFRDAARLAVEATDEERAAARANAGRFARATLMAEAAQRLSAQVLGARDGSVSPVTRGLAS